MVALIFWRKPAGEDISRNKERTAHIVAMLAREKSMEEAVEAVARCGHIEEFKGAAWES